MRRRTKQREAIFQVVRSTTSHPTADQVYDEVRKRIPNISKGTVYRNLSVLKEEGAISVLDMPGTQCRYEVKLRSHYHFRCEKCGRIIDLDEPVDRDIDDRIAKRTGFVVSGHQTEFRGACADCQRPSQSQERSDSE
jgi:Fur family peroxide stress response transcriptional regulator